MTKPIMLLGTASSVGKSTVATAFCRYFRQVGYSVAPYKALNISLNSFVTKEGDEIGRAQVVQAEACGIEPKEYMNPILMKPMGNYQTQVITRGKVFCNMDAYRYTDLNQKLKVVAHEAYEEIASLHDVIVLEGSGSCAEINLRETDIANMHTAEMADAPVILVADIDRGGVFASIVGTIMLLPESERARVKGVIINKFRGKVECFQDAIKQIEALISIPVLGVLPYFDLKIEDEDGVTETLSNQTVSDITVAVIKLPHLSNFTDFNALSTFEDVTVRYVTNPSELETASMIIIPGSKNTIADLRYLKQSGFADAIIGESSQGKFVLGICGGYQMLGELVSDPQGIEGEVCCEEGLGLLNLETTFQAEKITKQVKALDEQGNTYVGYEIHNGISIPSNDSFVWMRDENDDVVGMRCGSVLGTYLHGIFDEGEFGQVLIQQVRHELNLKTADLSPAQSYEEFKRSQYDALCELLKENIKMNDVKKIMGLI